MQNVGRRDFGGGYINNKFTIGGYIMFSLLCLTTLSTIALAISTGILDHKYKHLKNGYQTQSTALQQCLLKDQADSNPPALKCGSTYVIKALYQEPGEEQEEFVKYVQFGIPDLTSDQFENLILRYKPNLISASVEEYDGEITTSYNTLEIYPDGSLIIGAKDKDGNVINDITWGFPWSSMGIHSKVGIQGKQALLVDNNVNGGIHIDGNVGGDNTVQAISVTGSIQCSEVNGKGGGVCVQLGSINAKSIAVNISDITAGLGALYTKDIECTNQGDGSYLFEIGGSDYAHCVGIHGSLSVDNSGTNSLEGRQALAITGAVDDLSASCVSSIRLSNDMCSTDFYQAGTTITGIADGVIVNIEAGDIEISNINGYYNSIESISTDYINIQDIINDDIDYISHVRNINNLSADTVIGSIYELTCNSINTITINDSSVPIATLKHGNTIIKGIESNNIASISTDNIGGAIKTAIHVTGEVTCTGDDDNQQPCINIGSITSINCNAAINVGNISANGYNGVYVTGNVFGSMQVDGYVKGSSSPLVYFGGIEHTETGVQALQIGTKLGDCVSVKGSIEIEGDVSGDINVNTPTCPAPGNP